MNKNEYLSALKEALKDTDESVMKEIVSDYEEHFQVGIEKGKSEEQICEDLGAIDDLVREIKEVYNTDNKEEMKKDNQADDQEDTKAENQEDNQKDNQKDNQENNKKDEDSTNSKSKKSSEWNFNIHNIDSEKIGNAINSALDTAGEAISKIDVIEIGHTLKSTLDQAASSLNNFADSYLKNQGAGPFDFGKRNSEGYTENVSKSYDNSEKTKEPDKSNVSYDAEPAAGAPECADNGKEIKDGTTESKDNCENSDKQENAGNSSESAKSEKVNNGLNVMIDGVCADVIVQKSPNDKINIYFENDGNEKQKQMYEFYSYREGNTVYAGIRKVGKAVFLFNFKTDLRINAEIPDNIRDIDIKTASGDIRIDDVNPDRIVAAAASGDITANRIYTTDLRIKGSSGDIILEDINSVQLNAGTMSGDIKANNIEAKFLSLKSSSGDVDARNLAADIIDNSSLSGDLDIVNIKAGECKIRSTSGNIDINEFIINNADVSSVSGDIELSRITGDGLRAASISGDVTLDVNVKRCHSSSKSGNVDVKCNGDIVLESGSTSGNVNINLNNNGNGYCVKSRTTSGELYINYNNMYQRNLKTGTYTYGNQGSELVLSSVSGDIHITD